MSGVIEAPTSIEDYVAGFPLDVQEVLQELRTTIHAAASGSGEGIRYGMPVITWGDGYLVHFAGWKKHVALYPVPVLADDLERDVAPHRSGQDTVKFLLRDPIPYDLVGRVAAALLAQRQAEAG